MSKLLRVQNHSGDKSASAPLLRLALRRAIRLLSPKTPYDLAFILLNDPQMAQANEAIMRHKGPTDVITLDYQVPGMIAGEIYICIPEANRQARRFRVTPENEIIRYAIHGLLHLTGYDDTTPAAHVKMKRTENHLLKLLTTSR